MDSELSGLRCFLISINSKLISNQKAANQILEVTKKIENIIMTADYDVPTSWVLCRVLTPSQKRIQ